MRPDAAATGIITAIGEAHYERFKTLDTVALAKFELAEAVLAQPSGGQIIVHENVLTQEYASRFIAKHRDQFIVCGQGEQADVRMDDIRQTASGLTLRLRWKERDYPLTVPLFGINHAGNVALAFVTAVTLGVTAERATAALRTVPQIAHRLEVKPQPNGSIISTMHIIPIRRDFVGALELMSVLAEGRRAAASSSPPALSNWVIGMMPCMRFWAPPRPRMSI